VPLTRALDSCGEIVSVNFDPAQGSANKTRPAVIVSNDAANAIAARLGWGVITVVPVTSNITRIYLFQMLLAAHLTGLPRDSKAQAEQIRSVSADRVGGLLGQLPPALLTELDRTLRVQLSLLAHVSCSRVNSISWTGSPSLKTCAQPPRVSPRRRAASRRSGLHPGGVGAI
jgi:mRNA interferase MazF